MPQEYREGQTATNPKTGQTVVFKGGQWVSAGPAAGGAIGSPVPRKFSAQEQKVLNDLNAQAAEAREIQTQYRQAEQSIRRLKPGPFRARYLESAIPDENGGIADTIGSVLIGGPSRVTGAISGQDVADFQRLRGLQSQRVLSEQIQQKGPQTESDAARMQMTEISPYKDEKTNLSVIQSGMGKTTRVQQRADFYTKFANRYGLNGTDKWGQTVEEAFNSWLRNTNQLPTQAKPKGGGITVRRIK